ncbi:GMC oxidoreductase [Siccirubricoccus phaeus]|uniref:GMC oxidoreductase n=1 Tax=Siccirubricoccus phaeus TaxID=2595053 RepID=UPI0011F18946|nr:GMC family oxidoreductase [Siccirubricoccus phaeus]
MIGDITELPPGGRLEADLCIIGTGPTGLALAREFLGKPGLNVVMLEAGGQEVEAAAQRLNDGVVLLGLPHRGNRNEGRARAFGGTGRIWAGQCLPLDAIDYAARPWVPHSGWPIGPEELAPFLARAEEFFHVPGAAYDARNYAAFRLRPPGFNPAALRSLFTVYTPRVDTGADRLAEFRAAANVRVLLHAAVAEILTNAEGTRATGLSVLAPDGTARQVLAPRIVLCAGGLENARLLLLSDSARPAGLGNDRDLVGRFYQDHPTGMTAELELGSADLADLQTRFRLLYGRDGRRYFPKFALSEAVQREEKLLNGVAHLYFDYPEDSVQQTLREAVLALRRGRRPELSARQALGLAGGVGELGRAAARRWLHGFSPIGRLTGIRLQCHLEQAPDPDSRVTIRRDRHDALGLPAMAIDWRYGALERRTLQRLTELAVVEFARLGLGRLRPYPWLHEAAAEWRTRLEDCCHQAGTTRMAARPEDGVVDPDGAVFGVDGLYIAGGSTFPTSGFANPTLTMVALAIRLADHLKARLTAPAPRRAAVAAPAAAKLPAAAAAARLGGG